MEHLTFCGDVSLQYQYQSLLRQESLRQSLPSLIMYLRQVTYLQNEELLSACWLLQDVQAVLQRDLLYTLLKESSLLLHNQERHLLLLLQRNQ